MAWEVAIHKNKVEGLMKTALWQWLEDLPGIEDLTFIMF